MNQIKLNHLLLSLLCFLLVGCSGGAGIDESKPLSEVKAEAEKMEADELQKMVKAVKAAIADKQSEIQALTAKLKEVPITELMGEDAKMIKGDIEALQSSMKTLKERLDVYVSLLEKHGVDVSALK